MSDTLGTPFVFVPEGEPVPDALRGPEWIRIPATFVPHAADDAAQTAPGAAPLPRRRGAAPVPPGDGRPGQLLPGEAAPDAGDPVARYLAMAKVFRDPAKAACIVPVAGVGRGGPQEPAKPVGPAVPDPDKAWLVTTPAGKQPIYDIFIGGAFDQTLGHAMLEYARTMRRSGHNVIYFPQDANVAEDDAGVAIGKFIDSLPSDARINVIGHSYGRATAAKAVVAAKNGVDLLITVDPVSRNRPKTALVAAHAGQWIDINAELRSERSDANFVSAIGGAWETYPEGAANQYIKAQATHGELVKMMTTPGLDGLSPQDVLLAR